MTRLGRWRNFVVLAGAVALMLASLTAATTPADAASRLPSQKQWLRDVRVAMEGSGKYLNRKVEGKRKKFAINLDIDNSSLATHYDTGAPIRRVLRFVRHAREHHVAILFNTARSGEQLKQARGQLEAAGYPVTQVCGRRAGETSDHSKRRCRRHFIAQGYTIIANVGNRPTDFSGKKNYGRAFRLPNYHLRLS